MYFILYNVFTAPPPYTASSHGLPGDTSSSTWTFDMMKTQPCPMSSIPHLILATFLSLDMLLFLPDCLRCLGCCRCSRSPSSSLRSES